MTALGLIIQKNIDWLYKEPKKETKEKKMEIAYKPNELRKALLRIQLWEVRLITIWYMIHLYFALLNFVLISDFVFMIFLPLIIWLTWWSTIIWITSEKIDTALTLENYERYSFITFIFWLRDETRLCVNKCKCAQFYF